MRLYFFFLLCWIFLINIGCQQPVQETDALTIELTPSSGESPFGHMLGFSSPEDTTETDFWARMRQPITGLPDTLLGVELFTEHMQINQLAFYGYSMGKMDSTEWESWKDEDFDPGDFTSEFVDQEVAYVMGWTADSQRVILFDTNNNEDFSDEEVHLFPAYDPNRNSRETAMLIPRVEVAFDVYDGEKVATLVVPIVVNPFVPFAASEGAVVFGSEAYHTGTLRYKGQDYAWWATDIISPWLFDDQYTNVWFEPFDGSVSFPERPLAQLERRERELQDTSKALPDGYYPSVPEPYEIGDIIMLGGDPFQLAGIDLMGRVLSLERSNSSSIGLRTGMAAPDFQGLTLDSTIVQLSDYQGTYVLIDFWGTWCGPCISEIPHLREAYEAYDRNQFDILAVANDDIETLQAFVEEEGLRWTQVVQREGSESQGEILKTYRITGYPTTFLVDPEGVIVAREGELRGERLLETLIKHLGAGD